MKAPPSRGGPPSKVGAARAESPSHPPKRIASVNTHSLLRMFSPRYNLSRCLLARSALLAFGIVVATAPLAAQVLFDAHGFEAPHYTTGDLHTQNGWSAYVGHDVVAGAGRDGSQAAVFPANAGNSFAASQQISDASFDGASSRYVLSADLSLGARNRDFTVVTMGLYARYHDGEDTFGLGVGRAGLLSYQGALAVVVFTSLNDAQEPDPLGQNVGWYGVTPLKPLAFDAYHRFDVTYDFGTQHFDVRVNGVTALDAMPFPFSGTYVGLDLFSIGMDDLFTDDQVIEGFASVDNLSLSGAAAIPEPAAIGGLLGIAALGLAAVRRRGRRV